MGNDNNTEKAAADKKPHLKPILYNIIGLIGVICGQWKPTLKQVNYLEYVVRQSNWRKENSAGFGKAISIIEAKRAELDPNFHAKERAPEVELVDFDSFNPEEDLPSKNTGSEAKAPA